MTDWLAIIGILLLQIILAIVAAVIFLIVGLAVLPLAIVDTLRR